ncbi:MAG: hypothetical protein KBE16_00740, partial [Alphaproteobacteria bacterium]|nr:hypothetical protein [Alphaproteobacteria bacterium]
MDKNFSNDDLLNLSNSELLKIVIKIAAIVMLVRTIIMVVVLPSFASLGFVWSSFWENLLVPILLGGIVSPIIGFWIIGDSTSHVL